jgi:hypothetical protein
MGAALSYARRYALFTLVGIAGEDDLDGPDLPLSGSPANPSPDQANGHTPGFGRGTNGESRRKPRRVPSRATLGAEASAALREQLLAELNGLARTEDLDRWAKNCLPAKNKLISEDARRVEQAFQVVLNALGAADEVHTEAAPPPSQAAPPRQIQRATAETEPEGIDKSVLAFPELRRQRDKIHLRFVARQPCLISAREPCDAHHLRFAQSRGLGLKVSDEFTVPLCRGHHRELHRAGNEANWWSTKGVDAIGRRLWMETHPVRTSSAIDPDAATSDVAITVAKTLSRRIRPNPAEIPNDETKPIPFPWPQP